MRNITSPKQYREIKICKKASKENQCNEKQTVFWPHCSKFFFFPVYHSFLPYYVLYILRWTHYLVFHYFAPSQTLNKPSNGCIAYSSRHHGSFLVNIKLLVSSPLYPLCFSLYFLSQCLTCSLLLYHFYFVFLFLVYVFFSLTLFVVYAHTEK